jgi:hypothetical protein
MKQPRAFVNVLTEWLQKLARIHSINRREPIVITEELFAIYGEALAHVSPDQLETAFLKATQECVFFPQPAEILKYLDRAGQLQFEIESEEAWQRVMEFKDRFFHPDLGIYKNSPALPQKINYAVKAVPGGLRYISTCRTDQLQWAKKQFIEALTRINAAGEVQDLIGPGEAKKIVAMLAAGSREINSVPAAENHPEPLSPSTASTVPDRVVEKTPEPTEGELAAAWKRQKTALEEHAKSMGISISGTSPKKPPSQNVRPDGSIL